MARVRSIEDGKTRVNQHPTETLCTWHIAYADDGSKLLTLNTYGSLDRQIAGKLSQTIQLNEESAGELMKVILQTYPPLKGE